MSLSEKNRRRLRAVLIARDMKALFDRGGRVRLWMRILTTLFLAVLGIGSARDSVRRWCYRVVFTADGETLSIAAQHVMADLRDFTFARTSAFDPDPIIMARRQGRRDVWLRISSYLNLDEAQVQTLMEIDDGY